MDRNNYFIFFYWIVTGNPCSSIQQCVNLRWDGPSSQCFLIIFNLWWFKVVYPWRCSSVYDLLFKKYCTRFVGAPFIGELVQICKGNRVLNRRGVVNFHAKFCSLHNFNYQFNFRHRWRKWYGEGCVVFFSFSWESCFLSVDLQMKLTFYSLIFLGGPKVNIVICKSRGILSASLQIIKLWRSGSLFSSGLYHPIDFGNYPFFFHLPNKLSQIYSFSFKLHVPIKMKATEGIRC